MTKPAERVGGVILAAGEAKRFGSQKLLAPIDGRALVERVIAAATASSLADAVVVVGADAEHVSRVAMGRARAVRNPDYATGQSSSLKAGLRALADDVDAAVVLLGDVPGVTSALIEALIARHRETGAPAVASRWNGALSPPVLLHRDLFGAAMALRGDVGMREVLAGRDDVAVVEVTEDLGALGDVDTPEDHARISRSR
ncbi:MAG: nucleotidyltransferase family protein [Candidatus Limnocylindria bacterium]